MSRLVCGINPIHFGGEIIFDIRPGRRPGKSLVLIRMGWQLVSRILLTAMVFEQCLWVYPYIMGEFVVASGVTLWIFLKALIGCEVTN